MPKFWFGAILAFIGFDLMLDWLWHVRKVSPKHEYAIIWITFIAINVTNLELGFLIGFGFSLLIFVFFYARGRFATRVDPRSNVYRGFAERKAMQQQSGAIVTLELNGYIFFGSALKLLRDVEHAVLIIDDDALAEAAAGAADGTASNSVLLSNTSNSVRSNSGNGKGNGNGNGGHSGGSGSNSGGGSGSGSLGLRRLCNHPLGALRGGRFGPRPTECVILDFKNVTGMDGTAARTCFASLLQTLMQNDIKLALSAVPLKIKKLMIANGVVEDMAEGYGGAGAGGGGGSGGAEIGGGGGKGCYFFESLDSALEYCEDRVLKFRHCNFQADDPRRDPTLASRNLCTGGFFPPRCFAREH